MLSTVSTRVPVFPTAYTAPSPFMSSPPSCYGACDRALAVHPSIMSAVKTHTVVTAKFEVCFRETKLHTSPHQKRSEAPSRKTPPSEEVSTPSSPGVSGSISTVVFAGRRQPLWFCCTSNHCGLHVGVRPAYVGRVRRLLLRVAACFARCQNPWSVPAFVRA